MFRKIYQFILIFFLLIPSAIQAGIIDDLNKQISEQEQKRLELERQAQEYQRLISQKQGELKSLKNQIAIFDAQINKLLIDIRITEEKISQTKLEILQLEYGLERTGNNINSQKDNLTKTIQAIDQYDQTSDLEIILQSGNFSDFFNQLAYLDQLQAGVLEKVEALKRLKNKLAQDKESQEQKKAALEGLKSQLTQQQNYLASQRKAKQSLLIYTKGEEGRYQALLANVEAQKKSLLGDINRLRQLKAAELARLKEAQEKPAQEYWASLSWYYRQDDSVWANTTIGFTDSEMEDYGCAITGLAMVFTYHGSAITPGQLAKEPIFYYDLVVWPKRWGGAVCSNCPPAHSSSFDWFRLDRELGAGNPVIIFVRAEGRGAGHYVVVHHKTKDGRYVVHDPLFGPNIYLESTMAYIGALYNTGVSVDQMVIYR